MLTELQAINFKAWQDTGKIELAPITGLFGANGSGKSSLLQILLLYTKANTLFENALHSKRMITL